MSFSCTIKAGKKELTQYEKGPISYGLFGLGPSGVGETDAPYRLDDFRKAVTEHRYAKEYKKAAVDLFVTLQAMAKTNLDSLKQESHCPSCKCFDKNEMREPYGWSIESIKELLKIDAETITSIEGSY